MLLLFLWICLYFHLQLSLKQLFHQCMIPSTSPHYSSLYSSPLKLNKLLLQPFHKLSSFIFLLNSNKQASCKRPLWNYDKFAWTSWSELQLVHLYSATQQEIREIVCRLQCRHRFLTCSATPQPRNELTVQRFTYFCETKFLIIWLILHLVPSCWHVSPHRLLLQFCSIFVFIFSLILSFSLLLSLRTSSSNTFLPALRLNSYNRIWIHWGNLWAARLVR